MMIWYPIGKILFGFMKATDRDCVLQFVASNLSSTVSRLGLAARGLFGEILVGLELLE
jgi:hypothetical protein